MNRLRLLISISLTNWTFNWKLPKKINKFYLHVYNNWKTSCEKVWDINFSFPPTVERNICYFVRNAQSVTWKIIEGRLIRLCCLCSRENISALRLFLLLLFFHAGKNELREKGGRNKNKRERDRQIKWRSWVRATRGWIEKPGKRFLIIIFLYKYEHFIFVFILFSRKAVYILILFIIYSTIEYSV